MVKTGFIAFIDLLGTRERVQRSSAEFYTSLRNFQELVTYFAPLLDDNGTVYFFSDCAYVESEALPPLLGYLGQLRMALFTIGLFMTGAVGRGKLNAVAPNSSSRIDDQKSVEQTRQIVHGSFFGQDVAPVYALQDSLKGIGIRFDSSAQRSAKSTWVKSCHYPRFGSRLELIADLRYDAEKLDEEILRRFFSEFLKAKTRSKKYGRYYITCLVTIIRSLHFGQVTEKALRGYASTEKHVSELYLYKQFVSGFVDRNFGDLMGIECVYYTLLDEVYGKCDPSIQLILTKVFYGKKRLLRALENIPYEILNEGNPRGSPKTGQ